MNNPISIRKGLKLGELDAEADLEMLQACFVDNGQLAALIDVGSPASLVVGRTGTGKSALLHMVSRSVEHFEKLDPHDISVRFLEHSSIVQFFNELGVKLDLFYRMLWRHILTVELLKIRYDLDTQSQNQNFLRRIRDWSERDRTKRKALEYFEEWGEKFWLETHVQLQELTSKFTRDFKADLGAKFKGVDISLAGAKSLGEEARSEVKSLATQVVSGIQLRRLDEVFELLAENAFQDKQKRYYIIIDQLDEDWAETETRCRFIRALIEETKSFRNIPQVKIVSALRRDLLDLIFDKTRDSGFQEEKYEAYLSVISWSKSELKEMLDRRVREVYRRQYTSRDVSFEEVFPAEKKGGDGAAIDFILERTLFRPRDAIQFANECFATAISSDRISWRALRAAEANYSQKRLKSLREEWSEYYPSLAITIEILRGLPAAFSRSSISGDRWNQVVDELVSAGTSDPCAIAAREWYQHDSTVSESDVLSQMLMCLYHVGVIGIKISALDTFIWSHIDQARVTKSEVKRATQIVAHKMLRHALEIKLEDSVDLLNLGKKKRS